MSAFKFSRNGQEVTVYNVSDKVVATITNEDVFNCFCNGIFDRGFSLFDIDKDRYAISTFKQMLDR